MSHPNPVRAFLVRALLMLSLLTGCSPAGARPAPEEILISPQERFQTLEGFGASGAWWAQDVGGWEDPLRSEVIRLLFNPQTGIGLTIYRYNIGAGSGDYIQDRWRRTQTFEVSPGVYDWSRDANAVWVMKAARAEGVETIVAFANSAPGRMTVSGVPVGQVDGSSNLRPEMYAEYARYLVDIVRHLREDEGLPVDWISPINEPQWDWNFGKGQEGCHYEPEEVLEMTRALIQAVDASGMEVKVSVFESGEWKKSRPYYDLLLADKEVAPRLEHLAIHSYWSTTGDKQVAVDDLNQRYPQTRLWMSEWTEMKAGPDYGMDSALVLATTVHEDLTLAGVTSWQYWIAVSRYSYHDGLVYVDPSDHSLTQTKRLWAMGNFSRFIRPGFVRVGAAAGENGLKVSAYQPPEGGSLVVVVINDTQAAVEQTIRGVPAGLTRLSRYETSAAHDLDEIDTPQPDGALTFPAQSVTTLVYSRQ